MIKKDKKTFYYVMLLITMTIWGGSWPSAKALSGIVSQEIFVFWRFFPSFLCIIPIVILKKQSLFVSPKSLFFLFISGSLIAGYNSFFFMGLERGLASAGGILVTSLVPIFTFLIISIIKKKKIKRLEMVGLCIGFTGGFILLKVWNISFENLVASGNLFFVLAAFLWALLTILSRKIQENISVFVFSFYTFGIACVEYFFLSIPHGLFDVASYSSSLFWLNIFYLSAITNVLATIIYFVCTVKLGAEKTSSFIFLVPIVASSSSIFFLGEKLEIQVIVGGIFAMSAVFLINNMRPLNN